MPYTEMKTHEDFVRYPFPESYRVHEFVLTGVAGNWVRNIANTGGDINDALHTLLTTSAPGVVCRFCGHAYWDILCCDMLEPTFGMQCHPRRLVVEAIATSGSNNFGESPFDLFPAEMESAELVRRVEAKATAVAHVWEVSRGVTVLNGSGTDEDNLFLSLKF